MERTIVRYYKKGGKLRGCVVGILSDGELITGWSLYHRSLEQEAGIPFTKKKAREWALARTKTIPQSLLATEMQVREQCQRIRKNLMEDSKDGSGEDVTSNDKG